MYMYPEECIKHNVDTIKTQIIFKNTSFLIYLYIYMCELEMAKRLDRIDYIFMGTHG